MSSTTTRNKIGDKDIKWWDGITDTFTRETSTGGLLTLNKIGNEIFVAEAFGDGVVSETALTTAVNNIGTTRKRNLILSAGTWPITSSLTIPSNLSLVMLPGAILDVATTKTLTINSPIHAEPAQIFSWTGTGAFNISGSPTNRIFLEWWGAATGKSNDCTNAINKAIASRGSHQTIFLNKGLYRITSAVSYAVTTQSAISIQGGGKHDSAFWIDIGGTGKGFTFGDDTTLRGNVKLRDMAFLGPASCCEYGVYLANTQVDIDQVNFCMGASEYALYMRGVIFDKMDVEFRDSTANSAVGAAGPLKIDTNTGTSYANNVLDIRISATGNPTTGGHFTKPLYLNNLVAVNLSGSIEEYNCDPIQVYDTNSVTLRNLYIEAGTGTNKFLLSGCTYLTLQDLIFNDDADTLTLEGCKQVNLINVYLYNLNIRQDCRGVVIHNLSAAGTITDDAPDTQYLGFNTQRVSSWFSPIISAQSPDKENFLTNASFAAWGASSAVGYGNSSLTVTKCGSALGDTTSHNSLYSAKVVTGGATGTLSMPISSLALQAIKGRVITLAAWCKANTGQSLEDECIYWGARVFTVAARANSTAYKVGDGIAVTGDTYVCVVAGTSGGSAPSWPTTDGDTVADGTVTWVKMGANADGDAGARYKSTWAGVWKKVSQSVYVPLNATAYSAAIYFMDQSDNSAATYYIAEPSLTIGNVTGMGYIPSRNEVDTALQISANQITFGSAAPSSGYRQKGDIQFNTNPTAGTATGTGWICTAAGDPGTWKGFGDIAA